MSATTRIWGTALLAVISALVAQPAAAQTNFRPSIEISAGPVIFPEAAEPFVGASGRFHLLPTISVGPEVVYIAGENHSHLMVTANLTIDLIRGTQHTARRFTPYIVAGGGLFQTRQSFFNDTQIATEGSFTAGGGVRVMLSRRAYAGAEARIGWEPHLRLNALLGVRLGS